MNIPDTIILNTTGEVFRKWKREPDKFKFDVGKYTTINTGDFYSGEKILRKENIEQDILMWKPW